MKKLLWLLLVFCPLKAWGVIAADKNLTRLDYSVLVESYVDKADITIMQTLENKDDEALVFDYLLPIRNGVNQPRVYFNSAGKTVQVLAPEQAATRVFDLAKNYNQPPWLGAMDETFDGWWQVENLILESNQTAVLKTEYQSTLDFVNDFYIGSVWLADGLESEALTVNLVRAGKPKVWEANLGNWESQRAEAAWAKQWTANNKTLHHNLVFWASEVDGAILPYNYSNQAYVADYNALESETVQKVVLVLDTSGSVFGVRLERLKEGFKTMLETLPEDAQYKVALAGSDLEWVKEEWLDNTRENQRDTLEFIEEVQAQGKSDWEAIVSTLNLERGSVDENYHLVWLGDFSDIPKFLLTRLANAGWKTLMIDFWQSESAYLKRWWQRYHGQYVPLFNSGFELIEAEKLQSVWRLLKQQWPVNQAIEVPAGDWYEPLIIEQRWNHKALGQINPQERNAPLTSFLPRWWAQYKIADYLRQHEGLPLNEAQVQAVLSIAHAFGVKVFAFNGKSSLDDLNNYLADVQTDWLWDEILRLNKTPYESGIRYWKSLPFYLVENRWEPYNWETYPARSDRPQLEIWSEAHKNLFLAYPDLLAQPMSFGQNTAFCAAQRCASVETSGRSTIEFTDTLLWETSAQDHWALNYWADLVWEGVLEETTLNTERWSETVNRGQFLVWLQKQLEPQALLPAVETTVFTDLEPNQTGASQALWFNQQELFKGYSDNTARLQTPISRIEALKLIMTAYGLDIRDVLGNFDEAMAFNDLVGWTQPWGYEAYLRGLVSGYEDKTFRPFQPITQAEAFKLLVEAQRLLK